jgi:hypothetical protein
VDAITIVFAAVAAVLVFAIAAVAIGREAPWRCRSQCLNNLKSPRKFET